MTRARTIALLAVLALGGCGSSGEDGSSGGDAAAGGIVDRSLQPPWVTALDLEPGSGDLLLGTNTGFWRVDPRRGEASPIRGRITVGSRSDTIGTFLEVEPLAEDRWLGSGHPDNEDTLPQFLGLMETRDGGGTWQAVSRLGEADLHKIVSAHDRIYAFDAVLGAMLVSSDEGRTFDERFTPRGLIADFVVAPDDPDFILAATEEELFRSEDGGRGWRPLYSASGMRLAWPEPGRLVRADRGGTVYESTDRGATWSAIGRTDGEPYKLETTDDAAHLFMATSEGAIHESTDGGRSWRVVFGP